MRALHFQIACGLFRWWIGHRRQSARGEGLAKTTGLFKLRLRRMNQTGRRIVREFAFSSVFERRRLFDVGERRRLRHLGHRIGLLFLVLAHDISSDLRPSNAARKSSKWRKM